MSEFKQWALFYHSLGFHPIPVKPRAKSPHLASWSEFFTRQPTVEEIERWWGDWPDANIGLVQGRGAFVLDVDGPEAVEALKAEGVELPIPGAPTVITGKGAHYYLTGVTDNAVGVLPKVDVRSDGGYVVAPPSIHPSGAVYAWASPLLAGAQSFPKAPAKLMELLARPPKPTATGARVDGWLIDALEGVGEGARFKQCQKIAGSLWGHGYPQEVVEAFVLNWAQWVCTPPYPADEAMAVVKGICKLEGGPTAPPCSFAQNLDAAVEEIVAPPDLRPRLIFTGIPGLDKMLYGGFRPGNYVLLAARPSVGKSAFGAQIARATAKCGTGVLFCTAEMTASELTQSMLAQESRIPNDVLMQGNLDMLTTTLLRDAAAHMRDLPLYITTEVHSGEDLMKALEAFTPGEIGLVVVDYIQNLVAPGMETGRLSVEHISRLMKRAAVKFNVPVLALSALSRPPRDADGWRPNLADLRESGKLEHDADIVLMMWRELERSDGTLYIRKFRRGKVNQLNTTFEGRFLTLREAD